MSKIADCRIWLCRKESGAVGAVREAGTEECREEAESSKDRKQYRQKGPPICYSFLRGVTIGTSIGTLQPYGLSSALDFLRFLREIRRGESFKTGLLPTGRNYKM